MIWISLHTLRDRWQSFLGTLFIIGLGVTLIAAVGLTMHSAGRDDGDFSGVLNMLGMAMILTTFVSVFVIASTFAYSVAQRRREFALLRSLGAGPRKVSAVLYGEALLVASVAGVVGCALGKPVAAGVLWLLFDLGVAPSRPEVVYDPAPLVIAFSVGVSVAIAGVWGPARRIRRIRPIEALREASVDTNAMTFGRWLLGGGFLALSVFAAYTLLNATGDGVVLMSMGLGMFVILAVTFLAPVAVPPVAALLTWPMSRMSSAGPMLVRENMSTAVRRTASLCAPVLLTVGLTGVLAGSVSAMSAMAARATAEWTSADVTVTATAPGGLADPVVDRLRALPEADVAVLGQAEVAFPDGEGTTPVATVDPGEITRAIDPPAAQGSLGDLREGGVAIDGEVANSTGLEVGDEFSAGLPGDAEVSLRVDAVLAAGPWNGLTYVAAPLDGNGVSDGGAEDADGPGALFLYATATPGTSPEELEDALEEALDGADARVDAAGDIEPGREDNDQLVLLFGGLLLGMALFCSCLAIANTLVMSTSDRLRDFTALRLAGATRGQVLRVVAAEAMGVVALGALLGTAVTLTVLVVLRDTLASIVDGMPLTVPWEVLIGLTAVSAAIALPSAVLPARAALRGDATALTGARD